MKKRTFSAQFKADLVLELLRGERELSEIATANNITPNQLRNWKKEFLDNAKNVFDKKADAKLRESLYESETEKEKLYTKVGRLTTQVDWLKKKSEEMLGPDWESRFTKRPKDC